MVGIYQSREQFWSRVENGYNTTFPSFITLTQLKRSLIKRMQVINAAISKMQGCVRQVKLLKPSGVLEEDIPKCYYLKTQITRKSSNLIMFGLCLKMPKNFGDDVNTAKAIYHRQGRVNIASSQPNLPSKDHMSTHSKSPRLSSFSFNINKDNVDDISTQRPIGVKQKEKGK
ncbi:uncharacterized protein LOC111378581 [Olea europaea var. sylvestris]|uniref:uncharacterized protein LOC111378581 n=1 Tax=Olea europaea var. sylvestris TaxID=158386 RepID=UPI000C1D720B|nr:uncharacterized protein LOC111378581 [Olea europaea var. sylvestris]